MTGRNDVRRRPRGAARVLEFALGAHLGALITVVAAPIGLAQSNVLLVIADDVGVDYVTAYGRHAKPGKTPTIDALAERGVLFTNAWSNPTCSPTRATILTGRYGFRTGVGTAIILEATRWRGLSPLETTLPEALSGGPYHCEAVGKWHLSTPEQGALHPLESGFCHHRGSLDNIDNYYRWEKVVDGKPSVSTTYATTDTVNDAIELVQEMPEPWFLWLAFNAPHGPFHAPPAGLHSFRLSNNPWQPHQSRVDHLKAMLEAMDTELGRLLEVVSPDTTILFVGDNGTLGMATSFPFSRARSKGTVYEGGINVPLIIAGPSVALPGSRCAALVNTTDLFATILDLSNEGAAHPVPGPAARKLDSVSLLPYLHDPEQPSLRETIYAESFVPNGSGPYRLHQRAIRGPRYKLIEQSTSDDELYDLLLDPFERKNLLLHELTPDQKQAHEQLESRLKALLASRDV